MADCRGTPRGRFPKKKRGRNGCWSAPSAKRSTWCISSTMTRRISLMYVKLIEFYVHPPYGRASLIKNYLHRKGICASKHLRMFLKLTYHTDTKICKYLGVECASFSCIIRNQSLALLKCLSLAVCWDRRCSESCAGTVAVAGNRAPACPRERQPIFRHVRQHFFCTIAFFLLLWNMDCKIMFHRKIFLGGQLKYLSCPPPKFVRVIR